jgi:hypothetical protein
MVAAARCRFHKKAGKKSLERSFLFTVSVLCDGHDLRPWPGLSKWFLQRMISAETFRNYLTACFEAIIALFDSLFWSRHMLNALMYDLVLIAGRTYN